MPTSATGKPERRPGFTLVELLIVLTIFGLLSATVIIAMPDQGGSLATEAVRFASRAKAAQDRAVIGARGMAVRVTDQGYGFDMRAERQWRPLSDKPFIDYAWDEGTSASVDGGAVRIVFDPTGISDPASITLARDDNRVTVSIAQDGEIDVIR